MKQLVIYGFAVLLLGACQNKRNERQPAGSYDSIFAAVPDFSGVALVADHGKKVYHKAFGYRDNQNPAPNDTLTLFELASVSKQFTGMIIMMLKEEGKLNYDDPLEKFVPGLPYTDITIRHLLTHTSGLPDYQKIMDEHWDKSKPAGNEDIIAYLKQYHPEKQFEPGTRYSYSNTGYVLLGSVAEAASGTDFIELCRTRIFHPLAMNDTDIRSIEQKSQLPNFALGHIYVADKQRFIRADSFPASNYIFWLGNRKGPGRISSHAGDLLRWDQALYTENLIHNNTLQEAFQPYHLKNDSLSNYGFGWMLRSHPTLGKVVQHTGSNPGYNTIIIRYTDARKTIILLCNNAHPQFQEITNALEQVLAHDALVNP